MVMRIKPYFAVILSVVFYAVVPMYAQEMVPGVIIQIRGNLIYLDVGSEIGLQVGDEFDVYTTNVDESGQIKVGTIRVTQVFEKTCVAKPVSIVPGEQFKIMDAIYAKNKAIQKGKIEQLQLQDSDLKPIIVHNIIQTVRTGEAITLFARVTAVEDLIEVNVFYKTTGSLHWNRRPLEHETGDFYICTIPGAEIGEGVFVYYFTAVDEGDRLGFLGSESNPMVVKVLSESSVREDMLTDMRKERIFTRDRKFTPTAFIPGYHQLNRGERNKGLVLLGGSLGFLTAGIFADSNNSVYFAFLGLVYVYHFADLYYLTESNPEQYLSPRFTVKKRNRTLFTYTYHF